MTTNGTLVFTNDDSVQNRIHAYLVGSEPPPPNMLTRTIRGDRVVA
jgi:hypothetical protein